MIGFIIAMQNEAETLLFQLGDKKEYNYLGRKFYTGRLDKTECAVCISGIGKVNAAVCTQFLIDNFKPDILINFGLSGGLGSNIKIGDILFVNKVVQYDFDLSLINCCDIGKIEEFEDKYFHLKVPNNYKSYILATGDRFNEDKKDENLIFNQLNARLRDMEGGAIAQACAMNNICLYMFKSVSDKVEKDSINSYFENSNFALSILKQNLKTIIKDILKYENY